MSSDVFEDVSQELLFGAIVTNNKSKRIGFEMQEKLPFARMLLLTLLKGRKKAPNVSPINDSQRISFEVFDFILESHV
jgi:hypothetical protein